MVKLNRRMLNLLMLGGNKKVTLNLQLTYLNKPQLKPPDLFKYV